MTQNVKFRYVNEIAGTFVLVTVGILLVGIYFAGHAQGWFEKRLILHTKFTTSEGTYGLQEGAEVRILGTLAGRVGPITASEGGGIETTFIIRKRFRPFVKTDSMALVKKKFEVAGDEYVVITLGDPKSPIVDNGAYIQCERDVELIRAAQKMLDDARSVMLPILEEVKTTLTNIKNITAKIDEGQGAIGKLIVDRSVATNLIVAVEDLRHTMELLPNVAAHADTVVSDFKKASGDVAATSQSLPELSRKIDRILRDLQVISSGLTGEVAGVHGIMAQTQSTLRETERLIQGIQAHWIIRDYVPPSGVADWLDPALVPAKPTQGVAP